jgi:hypothetical protein
MPVSEPGYLHKAHFACSFAGCVAYSLTLKMEAVDLYETPANIYWTAQKYIILLVAVLH